MPCEDVVPACFIFRLAPVATYVSEGRKWMKRKVEEFLEGSVTEKQGARFLRLLAVSRVKSEGYRDPWKCAARWLRQIRCLLKNDRVVARLHKGKGVECRFVDICLR